MCPQFFGEIQEQRFIVSRNQISHAISKTFKKTLPKKKYAYVEREYILKQ